MAIRTIWQNPHRPSLLDGDFFPLSDGTITYHCTRGEILAGVPRLNVDNTWTGQQTVVGAAATRLVPAVQVFDQDASNSPIFQIGHGTNPATFSVTGIGRVVCTSVDAGSSVTATNAILTAATAITPPLIARGTTSQSADLTQWRNSAGTILSRVDNLGRFAGDGSLLTNIPAGALPATLVYEDQANTFLAVQTFDAQVAVGTAGILCTGDVAAATFSGSGFVVDAGGNVQSNALLTGNVTCADVNAGGTVTAGFFVGDGSGLTNLPVKTASSGLFRYSTTTTMADPGAGKIRANNATASAVTQLAVSNFTDSGIDASRLFESLAVGDAIYIQDQDNAANWVRYSVTAAATDNASWFLVPVAFVSGAGVATSNNALLVVEVTYQGAPPANVALKDAANVFTFGPNTFYPQQANASAIDVRPYSGGGQAGNLMQWYGKTPTTRVTVVGPEAELIINWGKSMPVGTVPFAVFGSASHTADLTQWKDSAGGVLARVDAAGRFVGNGSLLTGLPASADTEARALLGLQWDAIVLGDWTWVNQGTATATQQGGKVYMTVPTSGDNVRALVRTKPATPCTLSAGLRPNLHGTDFSGMGICVYSSASTGFIIFVIESSSNGVLSISKWNTPTGFASKPFARLRAAIGAPVFSLRVTDNGTDHVFQYTTDGVNWVTALQESRTAHLATPNQWGFLLFNNNVTFGAQGTVLGLTIA